MEDWTNEKEGSWDYELEIGIIVWWVDEDHTSDITTWWYQEHIRDRTMSFEAFLVGHSRE